ncbi:MAG TPA: sigma-54 dependent transcriptional regulator [Bryobacteraceae bacterium]|nr:sigma-54 dependent transcriptional regulator [Bryobacteraceae bacterium]
MRPPDPANWSLDSQPPTGALDRLRSTAFDAVVLDGLYQIFDPDRVIQQIQSLTGNTPIFLRGVTETSEAARFSRLGLLILPPGDEGTYARIQAALENPSCRGLARLAEIVDPADWEHLLVGISPQIRHVCHMIRMVGARRATVLITGETGTGKEIAARALHQAGPRRLAPWVAVNCSALPDNLLEAELFGHVRGAFTGAVQSRVGRFEQAQGGTLFFDEIGELPLELQAKLLRVLQEREFQRLGSSETIRSDVRIVAASNRDLLQQVERGRFREDLYYRLNVVPLQMPSLRQRREDIPILARHFAAKVCALEDIPLKCLSQDALDRLSEHSWPGNVRQLENAVEMAVALSGPRGTLTAEDFPLPPNGLACAGAPLVSVPDQGLDFEQTVAVIERSILEQALRKTGGNKKAAAEMLRLKRTTLSAKVRSLEPEAACN